MVGVVPHRVSRAAYGCLMPCVRIRRQHSPLQPLVLHVPMMGLPCCQPVGGAAAVQAPRFLSTPASRALKKAACPYRILGIPKGSTYASVRKSFLKLAMSLHPDVVDEEEKGKSVELFMKMKQAFDSIVEVEDGMSALKEEVEMEQGIKKKNEMTDEEFDAWFCAETGHSNPFQFDLDPATMREVADMTSEIGGGLDRDGGMWTLASMVSRTVENGKDSAASILRLEAGEIRAGDEPVDGTLRRRRRVSARVRR